MGKPTGMMVAPVGGDQLDYWESYSILETTGSAGSPTANFAYMRLVRVATPKTIPAIEVYVQTQAGNLDVGIYDFDGANYRRLAASGTVAVAAGGAFQSVALSAPYVVTPGKNYWVAFQASDGGSSFWRIAPSSGFAAKGDKALMKNIGSFGLPASISSPGGASYLPYMHVPLT